MPADRQRALETYRHHAVVYDDGGGRLSSARRLAVLRLLLKPGDVVLDVGCGTGLSFPLLEEAIGPDGHIIGIEQSPDMLARARRRMEESGWRNVTLIESPIEDARFDERADAALFCFVHDIMQTEHALANVVAHLRPGGRVAAAGTKWAQRWMVLSNIRVLLISRAAMTTRENLDEPWRNLQRLTSDLTIEHVSSTQYVAAGRVA